MAIKISDLPTAANAVGTMEFEVNDSGTSRKVTANQVLAFSNTNTDLGDLNDVDTTGATTGDGLVYDGSEWLPGPAGGGMFRGNNGTVGSRLGDIFRVNAKLLDANVTIAATENASATGPLEIDTGVTLEVADGGSLSIL